MTESRIRKSIKNSYVAMIMYFVNLLLQFYSRKIFLDYLGTEILGLNTTAVNLIQFLNLAELGIGAAIAFTLYKPLFEKDEDKIREVITLQGWLYKRIAYIIIIGAVILMLFFPLIFKKIQLPLWYAYGSFIVLLIGALLSYFWNYRQVILTADQKDYKIQFSYRTCTLIKVMVQMIAVYYLSNGYLWWLIIELTFSIIGTIILNLIINKTYPFLQKSNVSGKILRAKYPEITLKIKQIFFHKIGGFVLTQTSPIFIYAYTSLSVVALYGNYLIIINGCTSLLGALFNSISSGVGNLIAEGNNTKIIQVFFELFSLRFLLVATLSYILYIITPHFVALWIGSEYILSTVTLILMIGVFYISTMRLTVDSFIGGYGLFGDIYAPLIEAFLNISLSILLGYKFGLNGVIAGVLISQILVIFLWKPYYLFSNRLKGYLIMYCKIYIKHIGCFVVTIFIFQILYTHIQSYLIFNTIKLILFSATYGLAFMLSLGFLLYMTKGGIQFTLKRILKK